MTIKRYTSELTPDKLSYRVKLEVTSSEDIPKEVFVKQRFKDFKTLKIDDVFVAVATPVQLEDFPINAPNDKESFFRDFQIDLISRNIDYLNDLVDSILLEVNKLVDECNALNTFATEQTITIQ